MIKSDAIIKLIVANRSLLSDWPTLSRYLQSLRLSSLEFNLTRVCWDFGLLFDAPINDEKTLTQLQEEFGLSERAGRWCLDLSHQLAAQLPWAAQTDPHALPAINLADYQYDDQLPLPITRDTAAEEFFGITNVNCIARKLYTFSNDISEIRLTGEITIQPKFDAGLTIFIMLHNDCNELLSYDSSTIFDKKQTTPTGIDCDLSFPADQKAAKIVIRPTSQPWDLLRMK